VKRLATIVLLVLAFLAAPAMAQTASDLKFPQLTGRVVDDAHLLTPEQVGALDAKLAALETQSQRQLVVATVPDLGLEIEDYGYRLGRAWGIGDKGRNDGAILLVAPNQRKVRIEVGYGLEGILTDALSAIIIQREIVPRFKSGDYAGGINAATDQLIAQLKLPEDEARKVAAQAEKTQAKAREPHFDAGTVVFLLIFFVFFALPFLRAMRGGRRYGGGPGVFIFPTGGWGGGGGGGGGGSDWGGGSGFSGGGGSFGGGGASGDW